MRNFIINAVVLLMLSGSWNIVHAWDGSSSKLSGKLIKKAKEQTVPNGLPQELEDIVNDAVEAAISEMELLIEQAVSNAVEAAIAEQMSEGGPEDIVIVDSEGNELEILSMDEDGTITVAVEEVVIDLSEEVEKQQNPYERRASPMQDGLK